MTRRMLPLLLAVLAVALFVSVPVLAADKAADTSTHIGKVVSVSGNKLIMSVDGKEHTHTLAPDAKVTCDGKTCKLSDLKAGMKIRVTTSKDDLKTALRVDALDKEENFPKQPR